MLFSRQQWAGPVAIALLIRRGADLTRADELLRDASTSGQTCQWAAYKPPGQRNTTAKADLWFYPVGAHILYHCKLIV